MRHTWTLKTNIVSNIVSLLPLNYPPSVLAVLLVVVLVVVLLSCCCCCLCILCCCIANTPPASTVGMPLPPPRLLAGLEVDTYYTNADSSPATLAQAVCRALESRTSLDRPLPPVERAAKAVTMMAAPTLAAKVGSRTGLVWFFPPPPEAAQQQQGWQASEGRGNKEGNYNGDKGGKQ